MRTQLRVAGLAVAAVLAAACGDAGAPPTTFPPFTPPTSVTTVPPATAPPPTTAPPPPPTTAPPPPPTTFAAPTTTPPAEPPPIPIRLRLDRRVTDEATADFAEVVQAVLTDPRGWEQASFVFSFAADGEFSVVLAEGEEVDRLCAPYRTGGRFSCQIGPVVALNADRWRSAVEGWPATLLDYRAMLVNHEVGHLLGQHHPAAFCPRAGAPAAVMAQQSKGVGDCLANPWPLPWELVCARLREEPLAPPYEVGIELTCGPERAASIDPTAAPSHPGPGPLRRTCRLVAVCT